MGTIQINSIWFFAKMGNLSTAASSLQSTGIAIPALSSVSSVMDRYADLYKALNEVIVSYKALLVRDQKKISSVGNAMTYTDVALSRMFN